jgi:plastocyanin
MSRKTTALTVAIAAALLAACGGRYGSSTAAGGSSFTLPNMPDFKITATYPKDAGTDTIMEELPSEGLGTVNDPFWKATLGGYTQQTFSQALGFPPGTKLTIMNISKDISHTLNVVKKIKGPPAKFPSSPKLSMSPSGGKLQKGYASGVISPGKTVSVTLGKTGIYLIGCFFHYSEGMHDVLVVHTGATPGPQGTAPAHE